MTKRNGTKRALLSSVVALFLCFSMLLGTTFAWFTDTVTSAGNVIQSGTLDVDLVDDEGNSLAGEVIEFIAADNRAQDKILWEPGCTYETEPVYVVNKGNLALKYQIAINGITGDAKLLEAIEWTVTVGTTVTALADLRGELAAGAKSDVIVLSGHMKEESGNEYQDLKVEGVSITVYATQLTAEFDSFDDQYDAGAYLPVVYTAEELKSALENNESIQLGDDIVLTGTWTPIGDKDAGIYYTGTLDGNGHTISGLNVGSNDYDALISAAKDATIKNLTVEGIVNGVNAAGIVARVEGETVIENCVSNVSVTGTTKAGGIVSNVTGANAKIINCVNNGSVSCSKAAAGGVGGIIGYVNTNANVEILNCVNNGAVTGTDGQTSGAVIGYAAANSSGLIAGFANTGAISGSNYVGDGNGRWLEDENDLVLAGYCGTPANWTVAKTINTADELVEAFENLKAGTVLLITSDIDMTGKTLTPVSGNKGFTMLGNGYTISNLNSTSQALFVAHSGSSSYTFDGVVLKNCSVKTATNYGALFVGDGDTSDAITITNCKAVDCTVKSAKYAAAFVAYTAGYNVVNNGPVYSDVVITDCSVTGGSITGDGSVGAAIGHAGGNDDTTNTITNLKVDGVAINGEDTPHTGIVVGTANVGDTIINNTTYSNVTGNYNGIYGRFVPGTTGTLVIDGASVLNAATNDAFQNAINAGQTELYLPAGEYTLPSGVIFDNDITIIGDGNTTFDFTKANVVNMGGSTADITFENIHFQGKNENVMNGFGIQHTSGHIVYKNCTFDGAVTNEHYGTVEYIDCTFTGTGYITTYSVKSAAFTNCVFDKADSRALLVYSHGDNPVNVTVTGCDFKAAAKAYTWSGDWTSAIEIDTTNIPTAGTTVAINGCTYDAVNYSGLYRDKSAAGSANAVITVG